MGGIQHAVAFRPESAQPHSTAVHVIRHSDVLLWSSRMKPDDGCVTLVVRIVVPGSDFRPWKRCIEIATHMHARSLTEAAVLRCWHQDGDRTPRSTSARSAWKPQPVV